MAQFTPEMERYLHETLIPMRLSCITGSGWPVVLSLWYLYRDGLLYCATQESAYVVTCLRREPRCAFEIAADEPPYCGVRGQGIATIDKTLGAEILHALLDRYLGGRNNDLAARLLAQSADEVAIIIEPVRLFTWNYTIRMQGSVPDAPAKPCP